MIGKGFRSLPIIFANYNFTLSNVQILHRLPSESVIDFHKTYKDLSKNHFHSVQSVIE